MYLYQLELNLQNAQMQQGLANPHKMHGMLNQRNNRVLWRIDDEGKYPKMLVQSHMEIDWNSLLKRGFLRDVQGKEAKPNINEGDQFYFKFVGNASKRSYGKIIPIKDKEQQEEWLYRRMSAVGANVQQLVIGKTTVLQFRKSPGTKVTIQKTLFSGIIETTNAAQLAKAHQEGIGRNKAYGLGMLSLARCL